MGLNHGNNNRSGSSLSSKGYNLYSKKIACLLVQLIYHQYQDAVMSWDLQCLTFDDTFRDIYFVFVLFVF